MDHEYLQALIKINLRFLWGASYVQLSHCLKIHYTVMVFQYLSKGVGLNFSDRSPIVELVLNGVVKVHRKQSVPIVILNTHK